MVDLGVIQPATEPTDWVSSVAYSRNAMDDGGCVWMPNIFTGLLRLTSHHHTPTLEEITHTFTGSSVFSKLGLLVCNTRRRV